MCTDGNSARRRWRLRFDFGAAPPRTQTLILACIFFWSVLFYLFLTRLVVAYVIVEGTSMTPALRDGDGQFVNRWIYRLRPPYRGEVVSIQLPRFDDLSVKRIVALPYERVQIRDGAVYVNGKALDEPYLRRGIRTRSGPLGGGLFRVEHDCYFVLGDNRERSLDSRDFGPVHIDCILGRVSK